MKIKKSKYNQELSDQYQVGFTQGVRNQTQTAEAQRAKIARLESEKAALSEEVYELQNTPQVKADTEAAFKRGIQHQKNQFAAWLTQQGQTMRADTFNTSTE